MIGAKAAWSREIYKSKESHLCIQREGNQDSKGVLYLQLTVTYIQVTRPESVKAQNYAHLHNWYVFWYIF